MMAKKSERRSVRYQNDQLGCMWGLIHIFDFRHGRPTWNLIPDRRHGSKQALGTESPKNKFEMLSGLDENLQGTLESNADITAAVVGDARKPSVKKLMEEEMSNEPDMKKEFGSKEVASNQNNVIHARKDIKRTKKTRKKSRDMDTMSSSETLEPECSCKQKQECKSRSVSGVDEIMEEVCCHKHSDFEEKLCATIKEFMNQKLTDGEHLTEDQKIKHFNELMNAFETLSSDEELFLKLVQDPNSLLAKYVLNLQSSQREKDNDSKAVTESNSTEKFDCSKHPKELIMRKQRYFFRRKSKPQEREPEDANEGFDTSKRIIILKPGPEISQDTETGSKRIRESHYLLRSRGPNEKIGSHFFLSEIKRKLQNAMGKQQHGEQSANEEKFRNSLSKDYLYMEKIAKIPDGIKRTDKSGNITEPEMSPKHEDPGVTSQRVSNIYTEAKKHLAEMLSDGDACLDFSGQHIPEALGRILALHEYNVSPRGSPGRDIDDTLAVSNSNPDSEVPPPKSLPSTSVNLINHNEAEECHFAGNDQRGNMAEVTDDEKCSKWLNQDSNEESPGTSLAFSSPSSSPTTKHVADSDISIDIPERPSPVSVLDPLCSDDDNTPSETISQPCKAELPIQPLQIGFEDEESSASEETNNAKTCTEDKELVYDFVKQVMQASSFNWDDICMRWQYSDELVEPSLCDDVEFCPNSLCSDQKLLFDCISEVLAEVCKRYYGCFPWISSVKPIRPVPDMKTAIHEVLTEVYWHLLPHTLPHNLEQIVTRDLSRTGAWMDLRFDTENVGSDIGEAILQELMEDIILCFVDGSPKSEAVSVCDEQNET